MVEAAAVLVVDSHRRVVISKVFHHWRLREHFVLSLVLVGLALVLEYFNLLWKWDQVFYDLQFHYSRRSPPEDVIIVAIDEQSLDELGYWPWARSVHADLVKTLTRANARVIGLDIVFAEPDTNAPENDRILARAIAESGRVVLPVVNSQTRLGGQLVERLPLPALAAATEKLGHVDRQLDPDAIARSAYLRGGLGEPHWSSFALAMLELVQPEAWEELPGLQNPEPAVESPYVWRRNHQIWIAYAGPPGHFPRVSYVDVIRARVDPDLFRDKIVLVGSTAAGLGDLLPTPVSGDREPMPGVEVVANELDTLRRGLAILPLALPWRLLVTSSLVLIPLLLYPRIPRWSLIIWLGSSLTAFAVTVAMLYELRLWVAPSVALLVLTISFLIWSWRRLMQTIKHLNRELVILHEERPMMRKDSAPHLVEMTNFLAQIMPIGGCVLMDPEDRTFLTWGESPRVFFEPPQVHQWNIALPAIWTALLRNGEVWRLGLHWKGESPPTPEERRLLASLSLNCELPADKTPRTPVEFLQYRIQQVQTATERMQSLRRFISDTLTQIAHGVVVADAVGQIIMINSRAEGYLATHSEENDKRSLLTLLEPLDIAYEEKLPGILGRVLLHGETVQVSARGPVGQDLLVQVSPFDYEQDNLSGVLVNLADVTDLKESERRRRAFMAFLSHDLRTPLASILAVIDIAKLKPDKLNDPKFIENIEINARRTLQLADDFLNLARAETTNLSEFTEVDLVETADRAVEAVHAQALAKQIVVTKDLPSKALLRGDAAMLERALANLLSNAVKYSPEKSQVVIGIETVDGQVHCWVQDTGYGISEKDRPKLFARFQRIERREHRQEYGSGLGLAFVKTVIERHQGMIRVESRVDEGSCFHIYLPRF